MTQSYFPFDNGSGANVTETQWSLMAQNWLSTGVIKGILNELQVYADSTGMQCKVKSGQAWMKGHFYQSDAEEVLAIATASATNPRIDRVIVRVDWTANTIQLAVLQGTPAASPTPPALTQNSSRWEISLAQVYIVKSATTIASGNITDERTMTPNTIKGLGLGELLQSGKTGTLTVPAGQIFGFDFTYPIPYTTGVVPRVTATPNGALANCADLVHSITNITNTGFRIEIKNKGAADEFAFYNWISIG